MRKVALAALAAAGGAIAAVTGFIVLSSARLTTLEKAQEAQLLSIGSLAAEMDSLVAETKAFRAEMRSWGHSDPASS
ncbi:hypothetical protein ABPG77_008783 [Micractinium sp. CCAP 211/92]